MMKTTLINSVFSLGIFPEEGSTCIKGGMFQYPCKGLDNCPPCWIQHFKFEKWACYDKINGKCPMWKGMVDVNGSCDENDAFYKQQQQTPEPKQDPNKCPSVEKDTCLHGGIQGLTCKGAKCPPCWVPQNNDWACFLKLEDGKCPWPETTYDTSNLQCGSNNSSKYTSKSSMPDSKAGDASAIKSEIDLGNTDAKFMAAMAESMPAMAKSMPGINASASGVAELDHSMAEGAQDDPNMASITE